MKHIFVFVLALFTSFTSWAQLTVDIGDERLPVRERPEETPWSHVADSVLQHLDKSQIPSGILYDRVVPYAALPYFDYFQPDTSSIDHLRQAYLELWMAAYNRQAFVFTPTQLREKGDALARQGTVPLAVLDYRLHYLDTLAVYHNQLVVQNGLYYDVPGRSGSPYRERLLTLASPLAKSVNQQAQFQVAPAFLLGNRGRTVSSLLVNFDNGMGPVTCLPGQLVSITYPTAGNKVLRFTVNFADGTSAQTRASLMVLPQVPANRSTYRLADFEARDPFTDYNSTRSLYGKGEALVVLNNAISESEGAAYKLRNPVIIMDGFDPNDESKLIGDDKSIYAQLESKGILNLLTNLQRDLVIVNFPKSPRRQVGGSMTTEAIDGGTDYVERNAYVLETLLNNLKAITYRDPVTQQLDKFAVLGPSMAGVFSRYALAHMEKQQQLLADAGQPADPWWNHNTSEWISFDAPHMGANIPLADQYLLAFFKDNQAARDNLEQRLDAVVAKQFLVAHHSYPGVGGAPAYRDRFMLALRDNGERGSYGYPVHLRRVALADGKLNGQLPPSNDGIPCGLMFDLKVYTRFGGGVANAVLGFFGFSLKTTSPSLVAFAWPRFLGGANSMCPIFYGLTNETKGLGFGRYGPTATKSVAVRSGPQGSWDLAPGGIRHTQQDLHDQFEAAGQGQNFKINVTDVRPNHCFIPTVSALGFQYQSTVNYQNTSSLPNPYTNLLGRDLVCNNETPFDDFYAPASDNLEHVTTDAGATAFLIRELTPQVPTPVFAVVPAAICPNGTATITVKPVCSHVDANGQTIFPTVYDWTLSGPAVFLSTSTGSQTLIGAGLSQLIQATGASGTVTLTVVARRAGASASVPLVRTLLISTGEIQITGEPVQRSAVRAKELLTDTTPAPNYTCSQTVNLFATGFNASPPYTETIRTYRNTGTSTRTYTVTTPAFQVTVNDFDMDVTLTGTSNCDGTRITSNTVYLPGCASGQVMRAAAYPNPADAVLNLTESEAAADVTTPRTAALYNTQGREVRRTTIRQATQLSTADLPNGLYYLVVEQQGKVTHSQIRVQH